MPPFFFFKIRQKKLYLYTASSWLGIQNMGGTKDVKVRFLEEGTIAENLLFSKGILNER